MFLERKSLLRQLEKSRPAGKVCELTSIFFSVQLLLLRCSHPPAKKIHVVLFTRKYFEKSIFRTFIHVLILCLNYSCYYLCLCNCYVMREILTCMFAEYDNSVALDIELGEDFF